MNIFYFYCLDSPNGTFFIKAVYEPFALYHTILNPNNASGSIQEPCKKESQTEKNTKK